MKRFGEKLKKNMTAFTFIACMVVLGCLAVYYQYMKKEQMETEVRTPTTEVEKLIAKDLKTGYPETPTEVMKLWGRLNQCLYNASVDEEEFLSLLKQLRVMYSSDLLESNKEESHLSKLEEEVGEFKQDKSKIVSYSAEPATSVEYKTIGGRECANIRISYFINNSGKYAKSYQDFILVNEDDKWKILGFQAAKQNQVTDKEE
ncbi:MAG: hypothetical protein J1F22_04290 [Lachnospiraceae bacterium]|nr:hypothetical protein [Lachnospiraceae bacterium]